MATNEQRSFILYIDFYDKIRFLNDQQKANLLDAIFAFFGVCECPELDQVTQIVLVDIYRCLETNREKWLAERDRWEEGQEERSQRARKAANARWNAEKAQTQNTSERSAGAVAKTSECSAAQPANAYEGSIIPFECSQQSSECYSVDTEECTTMPDDAYVNCNMLSVNCKGSNNNIVQFPAAQKSPMAQSASCSADAERHSPDSSASKKGKSAADAAVNAHFEKLWALMPRKEGKSQVSMSKRRALMDVTVEEMAQYVARYKAQVEAERANGFDRDWMMGSTWFNKERWKDFTDDNLSAQEPLPALQTPVKPSARSQHTHGRSPEEEAHNTAYYASREE